MAPDGQYLRETAPSSRLTNAEDGKPVPRPREIEMREIETYLAIRVAAYLRYVFAHLRYG